MGKRGRKIRQAKKYKLKEQKEQNEWLTNEQIEAKKLAKKELRDNFRKKRNNYTK